MSGGPEISCVPGEVPFGLFRVGFSSNRDSPLLTPVYRSAREYEVRARWCHVASLFEARATAHSLAGGFVTTNQQSAQPVSLIAVRVSIAMTA
jgi:hypothetical protein